MRASCPACGEVEEQLQGIIDLQAKRISALERMVEGKSGNDGPLGPFMEQVFDHWVERHGKCPKRSVFGERRKSKVRARLKELMTKSDLRGREAQQEAADWLKEAVDGCLLDDWAMGRIRKTGGRTFNDLADHICDSESSVQKFREALHGRDRQRVERQENAALAERISAPPLLPGDPPRMWPLGLRIVLERLAERSLTVRGSGARYMAQCPAHDDREPSLSVTEKADGRVLLHCFGGCLINDVLAALEISFGEIGPFGPSVEFVCGRREGGQLGFGRGEAA